MLTRQTDKYSDFHLWSCPGARNHAHSWRAPSQLILLGKKKKYNLKKSKSIFLRWTQTGPATMNETRVPEDQVSRFGFNQHLENNLNQHLPQNPFFTTSKDFVNKRDLCLILLNTYCWLINISPQLLWNVSLGLGKSRPFQSDEGGFSFKEGKIVKEIIITFVNSSLSGTWQYPEHSLCETGEPPPCLQPVLFHKSKVEYWNIWQ